ncbi:DUF6115 domain-containing protein [Pseudalkalibacillus decolorationis]|uniref:DUF6115 domain-containing protein n=1 Tax=Pseudalkalibacillus decolorationis TaxID=163879 RepID=UPI002149424C|nr:hypothetical protein [Pseudalkalibacillus decolorationis]
MIGFLFAISFILHLLTLMVILIVWRRLDSSDKQEIEKIKVEMEDVLLAYTTEMKEENEDFLNQLRSERESQKNEEVENDLWADDSEGTIMEDDNRSALKGAVNEDLESYSTPTIEDREQFGPSLTSQVLSMYEKGQSIEEIAKVMNKGKGEIELLIKFYQDGQ